METIKLIESIHDLKKNLLQLESYLVGEHITYREKALDLIRLGKNFIAYKVHSEWRFAPSRFAGYRNNTIRKHKSNESKHGSHTSNCINKLAGYIRSSNNELEEAYLSYCYKLGIIAAAKNRLYWELKFDEDSFAAFYDSEEFSEGNVLERKHKVRERNQDLVRKAKSKFRFEHGGCLYCEICGFDFEKFYGSYGNGYIEVHHTIPLSGMKDGDKTKLEDICIVCSNCHRIIHYHVPYRTIAEMKQSLIKCEEG